LREIENRNEKLAITVRTAIVKSITSSRETYR
ncbi:hypothetical protein LCGC14_3049370, partial [marine sediment metagenome]